MKKALITGVTGQDGSFLSKFLLKKGYEVHGLKRRASSFNTNRIDEFYETNQELSKNLKIHFSDMIDFGNLSLIINKIQPDEVYHLAAMSHVKVSFEIPLYTAEVNALGTHKLLEAIRSNYTKKKIKFYNASTSELFGKVLEIPQNENTPFYPRSPYAVSKLFSHWITVNYREAYGLFASNGILFNHESPRRGETFVTKKITQGLVKIKLGLQKQLYLGNLEAKRDWGHAKDYVEAQWLIMQQNKPDDFVIATGRNYSVKYFVDKVCKYLKIKIRWKGKGINTKGYDDKGKLIVSCDKKYFRPTEVDTLLGNSLKAKKILKWKTKNDLNSLIREMVNQDMKDFS